MSDSRGSSALPTLALVGVTAAWGSTFFLIKRLLSEMTVLDFLALRFVIAGAFLVLISPRALTRLSRADLRNGVVLGLIYGVAQILQTVGLAHSPASVSGFVTGLYVVMTPLLGALVLKDSVPRVVWIGVLASTVGLGFLSLQGFSVSPWVLVIASSAVLYAAHILALGRWSRSDNVMGLSIVQMFVISIVCAVSTASNGIRLPTSSGGWASLLYMAIVCGGVAMVLQVWAQAHISAPRAAIIMTMEPVFAAFFAIAFGGEPMTVRMSIGGALVLGAMLLVELAPRRDHPELEEVLPH